MDFLRSHLLWMHLCAVEHLFITFWRFCCCCGNTKSAKKWWRYVQLHKSAFITNDFLRNPHIQRFLYLICGNEPNPSQNFFYSHSLNFHVCGSTLSNNWVVNNLKWTQIRTKLIIVADNCSITKNIDRYS